MTGTTYETMNDLPESARAQLINLLNERLADAIDLQTQAKQAHWNVKGPQFIALHKLFDELRALHVPVRLLRLRREGPSVHRAAQAVRRNRRSGGGVRGSPRRARGAARRHRGRHRTDRGRALRAAGVPADDCDR